MLLRRFSKCSTPVKCYLFKTYYIVLAYIVLPCGITLQLLVTAMEKKIKIAYNNSIRWLFCIPKHNFSSKMCLCLNSMSFGELFRKYIYSFRLRLSCSLNSGIDNIYMSIVHLYSNIWAWWHTIITLIHHRLPYKLLYLFLSCFRHHTMFILM